MMFSRRTYTYIITHFFEKSRCIFSMLVEGRLDCTRGSKSTGFEHTILGTGGNGLMGLRLVLARLLLDN